VSLGALAVVLLAAALHAGWNLVIARARDTQAVTAVALLVGVITAAPLAAARWQVEPDAWPVIALSSALELLYFWLLTTAYRRSEMSLVYPVARGSAPVIVLLVSVLLLGATTSPGQTAGVAAVALGVLLVRGVRATAPVRDVVLALAVGTSIAGYTLVDQHGVRLADPVTYLVLILVVPAIAAAAWVEHGGRGRLRAAVSPLTVAGGLASVAAYGLVLVALGLAPAASVAAVREVSVVMAAALAAVVLRERVGPSRWLGSVLVVGGVTLLVA
jgi:drug/metabolite transporter (DMT)-like permease